jgi:hypothetical protein
MSGRATPLHERDPDGRGASPAPGRGSTARTRGRRRRRALRALAGLVTAYLLAVYVGERARFVSGVMDDGIPPFGDAVAGLGGTTPGPVVSGVMHVHTGASHDAVGTTRELTAAARAGSLDWALVTDHMGEQLPVLPQPRFEDGILLMFSQERSLAENRGRVIVQGVDSPLDLGSGPEEIRSLSGAPGVQVLITHARGFSERQLWKMADPAGAQAWEAFNLEDAVRTRLASPGGVANVLGFLASYPFGRGSESLLRTVARGFRGTGVAGFDSVFAGSSVTAVASVDAHPKARFLSQLVPSYESMLGTFVNHVRLRAPLPSDPYGATEALWNAIENGRVFISFGDNEEARDFAVYVSEGGERSDGIGGEANLRPDLRMIAASPRSRVLLRLVRDGRPGSWAAGGRAAWPLSRGGAYRVEAWRYDVRMGSLYWNLRPWVFTNPVRVIEDRASASVPSRSPALAPSVTAGPGLAKGSR